MKINGVSKFSVNKKGDLYADGSVSAPYISAPNIHSPAFWCDDTNSALLRIAGGSKEQMQWGAQGTGITAATLGIGGANGDLGPAYTMNVYGTNSASKRYGYHRFIDNANNAGSGEFSYFQIISVYDQTGGTAANTDLLINRTQAHMESAGSQCLIDAQVDGDSQFKVKTNGRIESKKITLGDCDTWGDSHIIFTRPSMSEDILVEIAAADDGLLFRNFDETATQMYSFRDYADVHIWDLMAGGRSLFNGASDDSVTSVQIGATTGGALRTEGAVNVGGDLSVTGVSSLAGGVACGKAMTTGVASLTDGATISTNASFGNQFNVTIAGNRTMANPTNPTDGQRLTYRIKQDATGGRTISWGTAFRFSGGTAPVLTSTAAKTDYVGFVYNATDSKWDCVGGGFNY